MNWRGIIIGLISVTLLGFALAAVSAQKFLVTPAAIPAAGLAFEIESGSSFRSVSKRLAAQGVIAKPDWWRWYARYTGDASAIRAGHYELAAGDTPLSILNKFVSGDEALFSFTIIEGWNVYELLAATQTSEIIVSTVNVDNWDELLAAVGTTESHPEGLFLPETYHVPKGTTDVELLRQAYRHMQDTLATEWAQRDEGLPLDSPYAALILASIIEKETARADERPQISGVFVRRLQNRMRLQTDPTVIYGIGPEFNGNITRQNLRTDTAYNTYTRHGLPPTPIAAPGQAAIHAALHPEPGETLYFVATGLGDGSHKFSASKKEHDAAVQEYLRRQRAKRNHP